MKLIAASSIHLPARPHRTKYTSVTALSTKFHVFSQAGLASTVTAPTSNRLAIYVDSLGVGFGVAGARKQVDAHLQAHICRKYHSRVMLPFLHVIGAEWSQFRSAARYLSYFAWS